MGRSIGLALIYIISCLRVDIQKWIDENMCVAK